MKTKFLLLVSILTIVLSSCQSAVAAPINTATPLGQMETQVAATIHINETSTAYGCVPFVGVRVILVG